MHSILAIAATLPVALSLAACMPAKAPGSNPQDMTACGHEAAAHSERQTGAGHRDQAARIQPTKPANMQMQKIALRQQADRHFDYAEQHARAAEVTGACR